ncbi:hypothetical protein BDV95DRAFT_625334 [Massariosphaeria phaeospora]|uniref:RanBD1 domain-containing protein n=1 Tax=Massariosphaeria phaeospora TaxID=100035 RepID=A0A7C8ILT6_9PLEO|nr:hypothetical protein BDV95DRAFT_625334 [Massariosphaeria phaeospora]
MARSPERREPTTASSVDEQQAAPGHAAPSPSPARSDRSSDSEGKPVRDKLKETRIDAKASDRVPSSDLAMSDAPNGTVPDTSQPAEHSTSESDSDRGRLRRKRSREDFEDDQDQSQPKKKEQHARKKSRDITSPKPFEIQNMTSLPSTSVPRIEEKDGDESMVPTEDSVQQHTSVDKEQTSPEATEQDTQPVTSPKNKRTLSQVEGGLKGPNAEVSAPALKTQMERDPKRQREKSEPQLAAEVTENQAKVPTNSGFSNTSSASPFGTFSPKPQEPKASEKSAEEVLKSTDDKFKSSGFSTFSSSAASPFGGVASSGSKSPFGAAAGTTKVTSFAAAAATSNSIGSGFGTLSNSSGSSAFGRTAAPVGGGSVFGNSTLGSSTFGGFSGAKSTSSFASPGITAITGLSQKPSKPFGAPAAKEKDEDEDASDDEGGSENEDTDQNAPSETDKAIQLPGPIETGEEGEDTFWTGRAKLYTMMGEGSSKAWQERGAGIFKLNITLEAPRKARFVLRADGTHRLLLNAALTKQLTFGGDSQGAEPKDGRLVFNSATASGELELHLLKMRTEKASELWNEVQTLKQLL